MAPPPSRPADLSGPSRLRLSALLALASLVLLASAILVQSGFALHDAQLQADASNLLAKIERMPAGPAQQAGVAELSAVAARQSEAQRQRLFKVTVPSLLLLLLSLALLEPIVRSVRMHSHRLRQQATELQSLALVAEHTSAGVLITDRDDRVVWVNAAFARLTGWALEASVGCRPGELLASPRADPAVLRQVDAALTAGQGVRREWLHHTRDGRELWLDVDLRPLRDPQGALTGFVRVCSDVTARAQQQAKLQALWAALPAGVVVQDLDGRIVDANRAAECLLGLNLPQLQGRDTGDPAWRALRADGSDCPAAEHPAMRTLATGQALYNETVGIHTPDGQLRWLLVNTEPQRGVLGELVGVVVCFIDVTESRALQDRLRASTRIDALTRLPNREVVMDRLHRALAHARRHTGYGFAVLFMDFDRFKQVNDTLGHGAGDELLRQIAARLEHSLRPGDALARMESEQQVAARLGGDEFVVVLEGVNNVDAVKAVAQRLMNQLGEPYLVGHTPVQSSVSIGIVHCNHPLLVDAEGQNLDAEAVLRNADTAMYEAKRAGRARWVMFDDSMRERVVRALAVETDLRGALREDELFVVYQPLVDLSTRTLAGVEALVRWRHPTRGLVAPAEFISIAEESGLIDALGELVLRKACQQFVEWQSSLRDAAPRELAVNLSRAQLGRPALVEDVRRVLATSGMRAEQLQLEVTESLAAQDERVQGTLRELKQLGVRLALDDFGTGYSSLACLHQLPVDTVKVDRSFVAHAETVEYHRVLIEATIRVARTLGMATVAEGIETEGQAALMQALQCDYGQGYLFSRPLEAPALAAWALERAESLAVADTQPAA
jgi:diguanylate cyclase (GGDEF)-like protein/PAS domain S-box-containing protein